jgi:hypothetical protein
MPNIGFANTTKGYSRFEVPHSIACSVLVGTGVLLRSYIRALIRSCALLYVNDTLLQLQAESEWLSQEITARAETLKKITSECCQRQLPILNDNSFSVNLQMHTQFSL